MHPTDVVLDDSIARQLAAQGAVGADPRVERTTRGATYMRLTIRARRTSDRPSRSNRIRAPFAIVTTAPRSVAPRRTPGQGRPRSSTHRRRTQASRDGPARSGADDDPPLTHCKCGCGEPLPPRREGRGRPQEYIDASHRKAAFKQAESREKDALLDLYRDAVYAARRAGALDGDEALDLLISPSERVLTMLSEAA